ncbi:MAG: outer membrane protein transport protein [Verrucomicrobiae bacterium]|nr:outer membrane protein transport protein [Verrucomicrobiae bacterium]
MKRRMAGQLERIGLRALVAMPLVAHGAGFRLPDQDAFATGRGEAFVATADNPSAIYYNPAGLTQLEGHNARAGIYGIHLEPRYENASDRDFRNQDRLHAIPQLFYAYAPKRDSVAFGLGLYSPFGLSVRWPQDTGFRTVGTEGSLAYMTFNPVVAVRVLPNLSLGGGVTVNYANVDLRQGLVWPAQDYDQFRFKGDGWDVGFNLGLLWSPHEKVFIGATFRSATTVNLEGHTEYYNRVDFAPFGPPPLVPAFPKQRVRAEADFPFPLVAVFGISYRPTADWNFEFNADCGGWNRLGTVLIRQAAGFPPLIPQTLPIVLNWESSWYYEFGATRYLRNGWHVSVGYVFNENSVPDDNYPPVVADLDRHFWSVGVGRRGQRYDFDVAYQFGYGPTRTVSGSAPSPAGQTADGKYKFFSHAISVSFGVRF